jgi:hypothetical protein
MSVLHRMLLGLLAVAPLTLAQAQVPEWFDPADSTLQNAAHAEDKDVSAADATRGLIAAGTDPAHTVQAVIDTYGQCDAVFQSVEAASLAAPGRAGDLVQAAAMGSKCPCTGENLWSAARIESRTRLNHRRVPVEIFSLCGCAGAAAQAAAMALPDQADRILAAAVSANRRAGGVVDSLGQIGDASGPVTAAGGTLQRKDDKRCSRDTNPADDFEVGQVWMAGGLDASTPPQTRLVDCEDESIEDDLAAEGAEEEGKEKSEDEGSDMLIDSYVAEGSDHALVLFNGTDREVDLADESYQVELYFPGVSGPGRRIGLAGTVPPKGLYVVAGDGASSGLRDRANMVVASTLLQPTEAVVLRRGQLDNGCDCAEVSVAGTLNGLGTASEEWREDQVEDQAENALNNADSVGQVRPEDVDQDAWTPPLGAVPQSLAREDQNCDGDSDADDLFSTSGWREGVPEGGVYRPQCATASTDVVIAQYEARRESEDEPSWRFVELYNNTGATVDLAEQGYLLEVYRDGEREPVKVLALEGEVPRGQRFVVSSDTSPDPVKDRSKIISPDLSGERVDAIVLRRLSVRTGGSCRADVYAALQELRAPVPLIPNSGEAPGAPRPDDPVIDPDRGGELASPN